LTLYRIQNGQLSEIYVNRFYSGFRLILLTCISLEVPFKRVYYGRSEEEW